MSSSSVSHGCFICTLFFPHFNDLETRSLPGQPVNQGPAISATTYPAGSAAPAQQASSFSDPHPSLFSRLPENNVQAVPQVDPLQFTETLQTLSCLLVNGVPFYTLEAAWKEIKRIHEVQMIPD